LTSPPHFWSSPSAAAASSPVRVRTIRLARALSLELVAFRSTIRLPNVLPSRTIAPVVNMFSTSLVAVPAFSRVDPLSTSGPTTTITGSSTSGSSSDSVLQAMPMVNAPTRRAYRTAPMT
jgi:hypothetical protein